MLKNTPSAVVTPTVVASQESLKIADLDDLAETAITDLLANLMHLCSAKDLPLCELLIRAGEHFRDEAAG